MQKFINNPENLTSELLEGLVLSNPISSLWSRVTSL